MKKFTFLQRAMGLFLCLALIASYVPLTARAVPVAQSIVSDTVTDPNTASGWEEMMGTDTDGNRYAGRVWADRSVYQDGDTVILNSRGEASSSFQVSLAEDEAFQVVFSVLGSTMTTEETIQSTGPMDVVFIIDNSDSMSDNNRMRNTIEAANELLAGLLENNDVRLGITAYAQSAATVLPFGTYADGVQLGVNNYSSGGVITAYDSAGAEINSSYESDGYEMNTNIQAGFELALEMLANADNTAGRKPVVILLTDGAANTASDTLFVSGETGTDRQVYYSNNIDPMIALSTLLSNAYYKAVVAEHYGKAPMVYGIGVDLQSNDGSNAIIDPANNFNSSNNNSNIRSAYETYVNTWLTGSDVEQSSGSGSGGMGGGWGGGWGGSSSGYSFHFGHDFAAGITDADVAENINYVDTYYSVDSAGLQGVFEQIYEHLTSAAFNPITSSSSTAGGTGVDDTPLIYADYIGQYMEIKEIEAVTLFGASYGVVKNEDGSYTVTEATGVNPTTNEQWNTAEDIRITVLTEADGTQKLEISINQEILPSILEQVESETIGDTTTSTITELKQEPLRIYYTIGLDESVLLPNGKVDVSKLSGYEYIDDANGTVTFYANQFGEENPADGSGVVSKGDSHVGFQPSAENRYYYHQTNQGIFTAITDKDGNPVTVAENNEYGIVWDEDAYDLTWMTYAQYQAMQPDSKVYTYVTYYHPTPSTTDAANAAEEVTYLVYTDWLYLKESVAFYDNSTGTYLNDGKAIPEADVEATVDAYLAANPDAELYAVLGVGSRRTSRLHNMMHDKASNDTNTAVESYTPEYLENKSDHHGNDVVIWLGNNGTLTVEVETGIALTKAVTETFGNADDTYALTVTVPAGVTAQPEVLDENGDAVAFTYSGNVLTVNIKAGQTVYISGIPGGTVCAIDEIVSGDYYIAGKTDSVTVPLVSEAINTGVQFAPATVTNAPNKYGDLTVIKEIDHGFDSLPAAMADKVFTFRVELSPYTAGETYLVDKTNASQLAGEEVTVGADGSFTVALKDNESITILDIPAGTAYTVTEIANVPGYTPVESVLTGTIAPDGDHDAHFVNVYGTTAIKPAVTVTGTKTLVDVNGTYTDDENFVFALHQYDPVADDYSFLAQAAVKAGETYSFSLATVLTENLGLGEHYFRVTEVSGSTEGMSYDASRGLFVVHITDENADGTLEYTVEDVANTTVSGTTVTKDFVNTYDVDRTHADINIVKTIGQNDTGVQIPLNLFHFRLVNLTNPESVTLPSVTVTTDAAGKAMIRLSELVPGVYTYTLAEENGGMPGMTYDLTPREITVTVEENSGVLTASVAIDGVDTNTATFRNDYSLNATSHTISGSKTLQGRAPENDEFSFSLYETDDTFVLAPGTAPKQTVTNVGDSFRFDEIEYTKVGTYYYAVKEENTSVPGVTYDTTHYYVTVTVGVDGEDLAVTDVVINKIGHNDDTSGNIVFVNGYEVTPTQYTLGGEKILHGRAPQAGDFDFALYEGNYLLQSVTIKADGSFEFDPITYTEAGVYTYTIVETEGFMPGVRYDGVDHPVTVTVTVTDEDSVLVAEASIANESIRFENTYTAAPAQVTFNGTKTLEGGTLADGAFSFNLYATDHTFDITTGQLLGSETNAGGAFSFARELYTTGTYFFVIVEDASAPAEGITYDSTHHNFMVQVSDDGNGQLMASVTNPATGETTAEAAQVSADVAFINATFDEVVDKEVYVSESATNIDGQKVEAGDILTYHIIYRNYTGNEVQVEIEDIIPAHTAYVEGSASHGGSYAGGHINWNISVGRGESVTVSFDVVVQALEEDANISNTAIVRDGVNTYTTNEVSNPVDAPEPTEPPTEPTVAPTEPTVAPTEPTDAPTEPTDAPTEPTDAPTEPTVAPTEPTVAPTEPADAPTEPTDAPTEPPVEDPEEPSVPAEPEAPDVPAQPSEPETPDTPDAPPSVPDLPKTGDSMNLHLWFAVLFVCSGGMIITFVLGKKEKKRYISYFDSER